MDGADIRDLPRAELRELFGMVFQDSWLFIIVSLGKGEETSP